MPETIEGIDVERVGAWLTENIAGAEGPYSYELIAGGHSNLTFRVDDAKGAAQVLRNSFRRCAVEDK